MSIVLKSPGVPPDTAVEMKLKAIRKKIRRLGITREDVDEEMRKLRQLKRVHPQPPRKKRKIRKHS